MLFRVTPFLKNQRIVIEDTVFAVNYCYRASDVRE